MQQTSFVEKLQAIPMVFKVLLIVLPLLYVVAINMELSSGSQRYDVTRYAVEVEVFPCLDKEAAIVKEMKLEQAVKAAQANEGKGGNVTITREKLNIFSKWLNCGVL